MRIFATREQVVSEIRRALRCLAGVESDPTGAVREVRLAAGVTLLGKIQDNFRIQSEGGSGELGTGPWEPLAASTLALRRTNVATKVIARLERDLASLPAYRQRLIKEQLRRAQAVYGAADPSVLADGEARRAARGILERMRRSITPARYQQLRAQLSGRPLRPDRAARLALAAAHSLLLRDTSQLFNSLSPALRGTGEQILRDEGAALVVGTNSRWAKYHQSPRPRRPKSDGSGRPRLPRRQFLPDETHPMPAAWLRETSEAITRGLASSAFWGRFVSVS